MEPQITDSVLQVIAGSVEKILIEQREGIDFAFKKIQDGIKLNIGVNIAQTLSGLEINYTVGYPLEASPEPAQKQTVKKKQVLDDGEMALAFIGNEIRDGRMSITAGGQTIGKVD